MKVQFSDNAFMPGPRAAAAEPAKAGKDFAGMLAKASTTPKDSDPTKTAADVKKTADDVKKNTGDAKRTAGDEVRKQADRPVRSERTRDLPGHSYDAIVAGPRNGMYLNDSGNVRDGQAFVRVEREGRTFHIYGSGKDRQVFEVGREPDQKKAAGKVPTSHTGAAISPS
jgi:hypothetical protein